MTSALLITAALVCVAPTALALPFAFVARHAGLAGDGLAPIVEDNDAMTASYVMIDPRGRFYGNHEGRHRVSAPILEVGVLAALAQVGFSPQKFEGRGGRYAW